MIGARSTHPADPSAFDVIVCGAGAAGCVLAARLSERGDMRVLLLEAGPDIARQVEGARDLSEFDEPPNVSDPFPVSMSDSRLAFPGITADMGLPTPSASHPTPFLQGYGIGGGSIINGMIAFRGTPDEYDAWRDLGVSGWGWNDVLPYFKRLEHDLDFGCTASHLHGNSGPLPVRRIRPANWSVLARAFASVLAREGYPIIEDAHADARDGIVAVPMCNLPDRRVSVASAYLTPAVRRRPNLAILAHTCVERILLEHGASRGPTARGVLARSSGPELQFLAPHVVVTCGALASPALLMRAGIGPARHLAARGIAVTCDLPGVGQNLQNRPKVEIAFHLTAVAAQAREQRGLGQNALRYSSGHPGAPLHDMGIKLINRTAWHALGRRIGALGVALYKPFARGSVELDVVEPAGPAAVRFRALSHDHDLARLIEGVRRAFEILTAPELQRLRHEVFFPPATVVARLSRPRARNAVISAVLEKAFRASPVRRALLRGALVSVDPSWGDADWAELTRTHTTLGWHVCGTCRMGPRDDPGAVVDSVGCVHGVGGLRVADASIFPTLVGEGGLQLPVVMAAEKIAHAVSAIHRRTSAGVAA